MFVDSGAWFALFSARDQHHAEADQLFRVAAARPTGLLTTNLILAEVHRLILFRVGIRAAAMALDRIEASSLVRIEFASRDQHRTAREWLVRLHDQEISYTDAVSFAIMEETRTPVALSFDDDFVRAGFSLWRMRPQK